MSGPWRWDDLAESTRDSIDLQGVDEDEAPMRRCSCEERPNGWWLCSYHWGMQDAAEMYADDIDRLRDLIRVMPVRVLLNRHGLPTWAVLVQTPPDNADEVYLGTAFIQDANLWREVTGR